MASLMKHLASFSEDALELAINQSLNEPTAFKSALETLSSVLEKPPKKAKTITSRKILKSDKTIFDECIVPKIHAKLRRTL